MRRVGRLFSSLRAYQEECIRVSLDHFHLHNIKRQAVSLPVGSGKTVGRRHAEPRFGATQQCLTRRRRSFSAT